MGDLSENFSRKEFACHCGCGMDTVDSELITVLQDLRDEFGRPIKILSGNRCPLRNIEVKGSRHSQHMKSKAADIILDGISQEEVYFYLTGRYPTKYGIGIYREWVHIDVRADKARWDER